MKVRIVIFGTSSFGVASFQAVANDEHVEIVGVVSQPARPVGRKQVLTPSAVEVWAKENNFSVLTPTTLKKPEIQQQVVDLKADVFVVASYGLILPKAVLDFAARGAMNIHASLLPRYRGAGPIAAAIVNGDTETGITFMVMDPGCDTGPMIQAFPIPITSTVTKPELEQQLSKLAAKNIVATFHGWLDKKIIPQPQSEDGVSLAPKLSREDGHAIWDDATTLERKIRAYQPWPGIWTMWNGTEMKILKATVSQEQHTEQPGTIIPYQKSWAVVCSAGILIPTEIQMSGKKPQLASSLPGSYPNVIGSRLG